MGRLSTWVRGGGRRSGGTEFSSQGALDSYLRAHPAADRSKHSVAQPKPESEKYDVVKPTPHEEVSRAASSDAASASKAAKPGDAASHKTAASAHMDAADAAKAAGNDRLAEFHARHAEEHQAASSPAFGLKAQRASRAANKLSDTAVTVPEHAAAANAHRKAGWLAEQHGDTAAQAEHMGKAGAHQQHVLRSRGRAGVEPPPTTTPSTRRPERGAPWE